MKLRRQPDDDAAVDAGDGWVIGAREFGRGLITAGLALSRRGAVRRGLHGLLGVGRGAAADELTGQPGGTRNQKRQADNSDELTHGSPPAYP